MMLVAAAQRRRARIAPRWVRSAPKSRSTSRASGSSRRSPTSPLRPVLHRPLPLRLPPDPDRVRRASAPGPGSGSRRRCARSGWTRRSSSWRSPYRIVEHGRGGRANRIPDHTVWELTEGPGSLTAVRVSHWTEPAQPGRPRPRDALRPPRSGRSAAGARRCAGCATCSSPSSRRASGSPSPAATVTRPASPEPALIDFRRRCPCTARLLLPLLAALALAALARRRLRLRLRERRDGGGRGRAGRARASSTSTSPSRAT